jgi:hypothetical protein
MDNIAQRTGAATAAEIAHLNAIAAHMNRSLFNAPSALIGAIGHGAYDFGRGFFGGAPAPAAAAAVHPAVAATMSQPPAGTPVSPLTADSIKQYGALSPAARAVLGNIDTNGVVKTAPNQPDPNAPALAGIPTFAQMMAGYAAGNGGKISLTALEALAGAAQKGAAAGSAIRKLPGIADVAGAQALQLGTNLFGTQQQQAAQAGDKQGYQKSKELQLEFLERLARARAVDPLALSGYGGQDQQ